MNNLKYLVEDYFGGTNIIYESVEKGERLHILEGEYGRAEYVNENGRYYRRNIIKPQLDYLNENYFSKGEMVFGRLEHPKKEEDLIPCFEEACIGILSLRLDEDNWIRGKSVILETKKGEELKGIIKSYEKMNLKPRIGTSTRAVGSVKRTVMEGREVEDVQEDFRLLTVDAVSKPSAGSYVNTNLTESVGNRWIKNNNIYVNTSITRDDIFNSSSVNESSKSQKPKKTMLYVFKEIF